MELLLFIIGPLLAFGLPLLLLLGSAALGATSTRNAATMIGLPLLLVCVSALVVPAGARLSSTNEWPAPWWIAAFFGSFKYELVYFLAIAVCAVGFFYVAALIRVGLTALRARLKNAP
jgi:hypothetical protein